MANAKVDTGHGATITLGTSGESFNWLGIKPPKEAREPVDITHLASTVMQSMPGDVSKFERTVIRFQHDAEADRPSMDTAAQTVTITWPLPAGGTTQATEAGTGIIVGVDLDELTTGTVATGTMEIEWTGATAPAFTKGTTV